jgi:hypothetical protein
MDPLRSGAWEAGAFHPMYEALQNNTGKNGLRQRFPHVGSDTEKRPRPRFFNARRGHTNARNIRKSWGLNSLFGQGSLRIPLRLVLRPAQEVRTSQQTNKNLLRIT